MSCHSCYSSESLFLFSGNSDYNLMESVWSYFALSICIYLSVKKYFIAALTMSIKSAICYNFSKENIAWNGFSTILYVCYCSSCR